MLKKPRIIGGGAGKIVCDFCKVERPFDELNRRRFVALMVAASSMAAPPPTGNVPLHELHLCNECFNKKFANTGVTR